MKLKSVEYTKFAEWYDAAFRHHPDSKLESDSTGDIYYDATNWEVAGWNNAAGKGWVLQ